MDARHPSASGETSGQGSLSYLLYLYLWPFWMFRDVREGSLIERAAAYRHNRALRIHLPGYLLKWSLIFAVQLGAIGLFETLAEAYWTWQACCYLLAGAAGMLAAGAVVVFTVILVAYLFLGRWKS